MSKDFSGKSHSLETHEETSIDEMLYKESPKIDEKESDTSYHFSFVKPDTKSKPSEKESEEEELPSPPKSMKSPPKDDITGEPQCPICFQKPSNSVVLRCGHIFCWPCLSGWFDHNKTCPLCSFPIDVDCDVIPVYGSEDGTMTSDTRPKPLSEAERKVKMKQKAEETARQRLREQHQRQSQRQRMFNPLASIFNPFSSSSSSSPNGGFGPRAGEEERGGEEGEEGEIHDDVHQDSPEERERRKQQKRTEMLLTCFFVVIMIILYLLQFLSKTKIFIG
ncbi:E3 ubiquitin-protein ligase RNF5/RNF185-like protein [Aduncisulcus paluster]|uniref:RING-type E3 ubiquitin transferase n=1 Tax=Aduncisulcus paluster TaxID=2918883 RepID=A0ABQ5K3W0_9EUKA|nr:E3 ubiquitin-protein ligase RNF5/RNF185-like protein [Aduncisulcus paluster]